METKTKYARRCDITGKGMNVGWIDEEESKYFKKEEDAANHILLILRKDESTRNYLGIDLNTVTNDKLLEAGYNHYHIYYTEWDEIEEGENWYDENGIEFMNCYKCNEEVKTDLDFCSNCLTQL